MRFLAALVSALTLCLAHLPAGAMPSTFGPVIGSALLCRSHLDNVYFHSYMTASFGPAYKHEGGAYWFKTDATLWGAAVKDVLVSDDSSEHVFIGAVIDGTPDELAQAIRSAAGQRHRAVDASQFPLRVSVPGSTIVYHNTKSKIYCDRYKQQPARR